jgi:hypothetical protein
MKHPHEGCKWRHLFSVDRNAGVITLPGVPSNMRCSTGGGSVGVPAINRKYQHQGEYQSPDNMPRLNAGDAVNVSTLEVSAKINIQMVTKYEEVRSKALGLIN